MAKQIITVLTDDLDGGDADRTIEFGLDGVNYTIDLSEKNAGKLRKALDPYLTVASKVGRSGTNGRIAFRRPAVSTRSNRDQNQAIREWATRNGYQVSERGRIPSPIVEAFHSKRSPSRSDRPVPARPIAGPVWRTPLRSPPETSPRRPTNLEWTADVDTGRWCQRNRASLESPVAAAPRGRLQRCRASRSLAAAEPAGRRAVVAVGPGQLPIGLLRFSEPPD